MIFTEIRRITHSVICIETVIVHHFIKVMTLNRHLGHVIMQATEFTTRGQSEFFLMTVQPVSRDDLSRETLREVQKADKKR